MLVTGASGFLGSHLCRSLLERGCQVHGISRRRQPGTGVVWHQLDLSDVDRALALFDAISPEVVFHLASEVTGDRTIPAVVATMRSNLLSTVGVLAASSSCGCRRVVLAGSMEELGGPAGIPGSGYAAAKLSATTYARMFHASHALSIVNLRLFMVYGPGQTDETKLVPYAIRSFLSRVPPEIGSGNRPVDWVYAADVVDAFIAGALAESGDDADPIDIGSGELVTIREMVELVAQATRSDVAPHFGARADRSHETVVPASLDRARRHLGWAPETSLLDGVSRTVDWFAAAAEAD
jgi:UDP-glucose 4-epimerase